MYGIHNNHDHIDEEERVKGDRGWEKGEGGRMERGGGKMRETGVKGKKGEKGEKSRGREKGEGRKESRERERRRGVGEGYPLSSPHRFRDSFCLFGITNAHHTPVI